jgi:Fe-S cluster biosynthesis and repair protein YggX
MADLQARIEQFQKMAQADPENELGHYSLGRAYLDAGNLDGAAAAFAKVLQLNPQMSRAYEMLAGVLLKQNHRDQAIQLLHKGIEVAHGRGDIMPRDQMLAVLKEIGAPAPQLASTAHQQAVGEGQVLCHRCSKVGRRLPKAPFRNAQGQLIQEKICGDCWQEWIRMGTKVINELRLPLADPQAQKVYEQHMAEFLNLPKG